MIISINGMDNSGKTTQTKRLMKKYPELFIMKIHINDTTTFDKEKFDYNWWFNTSSPIEFVRTIYQCLQERIEYAKSIDMDDKIIIIEKGLDFYEARITATLLSKGLNLYEAIILQARIRQEFNLEEIEEIKFYLKSGNYKVESDISENIQYKTYLQNNRYLLERMNVDYVEIESGNIEDVTESIMDIIRERRCNKYARKLLLQLSPNV